MIRIGVVNIDVSHPKAFSEYLAKGNRARYVAVYNDGFRGDDEVESFIHTFGLEKRCSSVEELASMVDIGFIQGCNWDKHLAYAEPFLRMGKPVFLDKPMVGNPADCEKVRALVRGGAVILGSSSARYAYEIEDFLKQPEEERGVILSVYGTSGVDEFNYGIHIVEAFGGLLGDGAVSCRFAAHAERAGKSCDTYCAAYANGVTATYSLFEGKWHPFVITIMTTKGTFSFKIDTGKIYGAMLDRICTYMETGVNTLAGIDSIIESIRIMLAGRISKLKGGEVVRLEDIPADDPGFDGNAFEKGYAAAAKKIYLA